MARVTIEDCMEIVGNRFELSIIAMKRAKQIVMKKIDLMEKERRLSQLETGYEASDEVPVSEVVEKNMDKSSRVQDEHKPVISALKEIAEGKLKFHRPNGGTK